MKKPYSLTYLKGSARAEDRLCSFLVVIRPLNEMFVKLSFMYISHIDKTYLAHTMRT